MPRLPLSVLWGGRGFWPARWAVPAFVAVAVAAAIAWGVQAGLGKGRPVPVMEFRGALVAIDPGHGGPDPGAVGAAGVREKDVVLAIALRLEGLLNRAGVYTLVTRREDVDLADEGASPRKAQDLRRRAERANVAAADVFVSIHANAFPGSRWRGAQTFYFPGDGQGRRLATAIQDALQAEFGPSNRRPQPGNYRVLRDTVMPAAVVEVGFLSNPAEEQLLAEPGHQGRLAHAIYEGILQFLKSP